MLTKTLLHLHVHLIIFTSSQLLFPLQFTTASPVDHRYNLGDHVPLFANKVGPLHNPSETYQFYDLPFCHPDPVIQKKVSLGEVLNGDRLTNTLYNLKFQEVKIGETLCERKLTRDEVARFRDAVAKEFYFQMYYDDLPLWGFIGKVEESWVPNEKQPRYYLFTHVQFDAFFKDDQITEIHAFSDPSYLLDITEDNELEVKSTYSVFWNSSSVTFEDRMGRYSRASSHPIHRQIHWFSLVNAVVLVGLLICLFALLMRHLKNELRTCSGGDVEEDKEAARKNIHGDVFRLPTNMPLLCAIVGSGMQLLTTACFASVLALLSIFYPYNRGALSTALLLIFALASVVGGFTAAFYNSQLAETRWAKSVKLTGVVYPGPLVMVASVLNTIAWMNGSTTALPFGTILVILSLYTILALPLLALGGIMGHHFRSETQAPLAGKKHSKEKLRLAWYSKAPAQIFLGGLLSFSAIVLELHEICTSLWGFKITVLPSTLVATFLILIILTAILSAGLTYIQLSCEDPDWWWRSVLRGGSTAIFMFAYCIYFYAQSNMRGFFQLSVFLGYNACLCYSLFLMLGTVSFLTSLVFVRHIYRDVKSE